MHNIKNYKLKQGALFSEFMEKASAGSNQELSTPVAGEMSASVLKGAVQPAHPSIHFPWTRLHLCSPHLIFFVKLNFRMPAIVDNFQVIYVHPNLHFRVSETHINFNVLQAIKLNTSKN